MRAGSMVETIIQAWRNRPVIVKEARVSTVGMEEMRRKLPYENSRYVPSLCGIPLLLDEDVPEDEIRLVSTDGSVATYKIEEAL